LTWTKLDDGILDHPKIAQVGLMGYAWFTAGLVYSNRNLTDGFIPYGVARKLFPLINTDSELRVWSAGMTCGMMGYDGEEAIEQVIGWLTGAGLWDEVPGGYTVHDFLDWNPSRTDVLSLREKRTEAGKRGGKASVASKTSSKRSSKTEANFNPVPGPVPVPKKAAFRNEDVENLDWSESDPDQTYFLRRLRGVSENWAEITPDVLSHLNASLGSSAVHLALGHAHDEHLAAESPIAWIRAACNEASA
jgi:hypothetical protein